MRKTLKVLFLAADPFHDRARLELGEEMRAIGEAIRRGTARDSVELVAHFGTRVRDLQRALLEHEPQIVHFAGHGGEAGVLYLGDEQGEPRAVGRDAVGRLFGILEGEVRVVVLNGCHTRSMVEVLGEVVDHAIGTQRRISDAAAITFAEAFYSALAFGRSVPVAFDLAVNQLQLEGSTEADTPMLHVRPGASARPLVEPDGDREDAGPRGMGADDGPVMQNVRADEIAAERFRMTGREGRGGPGGGSVMQNFNAGRISGGDFEITGVRSDRARD